ncbi:MAG: hypothetical protein ACK52S_00715 [Pirellula sp.]
MTGREDGFADKPLDYLRGDYLRGDYLVDAFEAGACTSFGRTDLPDHVDDGPT